MNLAERVSRVRLLLETLDDPYPRPRGALDSDSGPAASRYVPCETCRGCGELRRRGGWALCLICDGRGWKRREHGEQEWDAYVELPLDVARELPRERGVRAQLPPELHEQTFGWERARRTYDRHGSYRALRSQLDWLSLTAPRRYWLVRGVLVEHEPRELSSIAVMELELGVVMIARRMPTVRVPPWLIERSAAAELRETVAELAAAGMSASAIAKRLGMTKKAARRRLKHAVGSA